jgi:hypothetical protein
VTRALAFTTAGFAAGFSGLAVLMYILTPVPLLMAEIGAMTASFVGLGIVVYRAPRAVVVELARTAAIGLGVGAVGTLVYDATRTGLSLLDPSPYNPFEAVRQFGLAFLDPGADPALIMAVGWLLHLLNGSTFGGIYAFFARDHLGSPRTALVSGMAWGLALEGIQSILYPGWLGITTVLGEFLVISGAGHLVYGATLGFGVRALLLRDRRREEFA